MKVLYERVAGIDVHKDMVKVAIRSTGVAHVAMEASGVYTEPVICADRGKRP
jgi:hypothetical protein